VSILEPLLPGLLRLPEMVAMAGRRVARWLANKLLQRNLEGKSVLAEKRGLIVSLGTP
jgi:hypothetical protein